MKIILLYHVKHVGNIRKNYCGVDTFKPNKIDLIILKMNI